MKLSLSKRIAAALGLATASLLPAQTDPATGP